jgi:hypothetical protein
VEAGALLGPRGHRSALGCTVFASNGCGGSSMAVAIEHVMVGSERMSK